MTPTRTPDRRESQALAKDGEHQTGESRAVAKGGEGPDGARLEATCSRIPQPSREWSGRPGDATTVRTAWARV